MKIIFFNINQFNNDPKGLEKFFTDHKKTVDIFCIQEIPETPINSLNDILYDYYKFHFSKILPDYNCRADLSTFVKKTSFDQIEQKAINVGHSDVTPAILTSFEYTNKTYNLINYHGIALPGHKNDTKSRIKASRLIIKCLNSLDGHKIIGGDFNLNPESKSIRMFEQAGYLNLIKEYNIKTTRNNNAWKLYPDGKQYYADYTLVDSDLKINSFDVINTQISDHLPMVLDIA
ncbi:MAG: endonuclease/exonuclease/phosphatase family protein [Polynucleobacter sp.]|nr:endonuclease/exonuclease/phosphatase family protein [Polynucleobacter sp.]